MKNWKAVSIGDCVEKVISCNPLVTIKNDFFDYLDISSVDRVSKSIIGATKTKGLDAPSRARQLVKQGDILVSSVRPNLNAVATVTNNFNGAIASTGFCVLRPKRDVIDSNYLFHWVKTEDFIKDMMEKATGANYPAISDRIVKGSVIPLPPLAEQIHIAQVLDQADRLRQQDRQLLAHYDQLVQAVFMDMFGDPVRNEKGWNQSKVIDYCSCIVPGRDKPKSFSGSTPWITTGDLLHLGFTDKSKKDVGLNDLEINEVNARVVPAGSVIMTCVGELGIISILNEDAVVNQQLHAFQCKSEVNNVFLMYCLSYQKAYMEKMASSTTIPYMNKTVCNSVPIVVPTMALQNRFAEIAKKAQIQKAATQQLQAQSDALFQSLLQQAFRGELTRPEPAAGGAAGAPTGQLALRL